MINSLYCITLRIMVGTAASLAVQPVLAQDDGGGDPQNLLEQVGREYAEAYMQPLVDGFGACQNSGLYTSAHIPVARLTVGFAV